MSDIAIRVENLGKSYRIAHSRTQGRYKTLQEDVIGLLKRPFQRGVSTPTTEEFWALKDISFEVKQGEVLGIIGRNGAGKSTLLKILSRITRPTVGYAEMHGRIGSLLEVGTGFHPELTGRENIFLNGAVLGMSRRDIQKRFDEIVAFAEVEKFLDTPVKRYSSGMYMRLAFGVAAHLEPEILVVDEVLAVGDAEFQKKSLGKMSEVAQSGRTVLFVSHNLGAIRFLCTKGLLLTSGRSKGVEAIERAITAYLVQSPTNIEASLFPIERDDLVIHHFELKQNHTSVDHVDGSLPLNLRVDLEVLKNLTSFRMGIYLRTDLGDLVFRSFAADWNPKLETIEAGLYSLSATIPSNFLAPGHYNLHLHASRFGIRDYGLEQIVVLRISVDKPPAFNAAHPDDPDSPGMVLTNLKWHLEACTENVRY